MNSWRVFADANILFSASLPRGVVATLTEAIRRRHEIVTCQLAVDEARRNLARKQPQALAGLEAALTRVTIVPEGDFAHSWDLPANDGALLSAAVAARCTHFLSGDKRHFGAFYGKEIEGVRVVNPAMLLIHPDLL